MIFRHFAEFPKSVLQTGEPALHYGLIAESNLGNLRGQIHFGQPMSGLTASSYSRILQAIVKNRWGVGEKTGGGGGKVEIFVSVFWGLN